ncbi:kinase-like domain-containing protein [Hysterangium stoloniferum]|nr:kinase-like domain-containing protein [Hysterangium stoloniferum]
MKDVDDLKERAYKALRKLSLAENTLPSHMVLSKSDFACISTHPVEHGGFSNVYKAKYLGKDVALKRCRTFTGNTEADVLARKHRAWQREIITLSQLRHKNILQLVGILDEGPDWPVYTMVSNWMVHGTARSFLKRRDAQARIFLLHEVSCAMQYLHNHRPPIVHGDIKGTNIFVDESGRAVLGDMGLSMHLRSTNFSSSIGLENVGTIRWMAPELFRPSDKSKFTLASDIWAFAMTMLEIFTDQVPYHHLENDIFVLTHIVSPSGPVLPTRPGPEVVKGLEDSLWMLMEACWSIQEGERPSANFIEEILNIV